MTRALKNVAASVQTRLLQLSQKGGDDYLGILSRYALERLLYRIGLSPHRRELVLKGALVQDALAYRQPDFVGCFDGGSGEVALEWRVSNAGQAEEIRSAGSKVAPATDCIQGQLQSVTFPGGRETWVSHRFSRRQPALLSEREPGDGGLTAEQVAALVHDRLFEVSGCYAAARKERPTLEGRLTVLLKVGPSGSVLASSIEEASGRVQASTVGPCLLRGVRDWTFAKSADGHPRVVRQFQRLPCLCHPHPRRDRQNQTRRRTVRQSLVRRNPQASRKL